MKIGFIGLGNMGEPMAKNLAKAGYEIFGYDILKKDIKNINIVKTIEEACNQMEIVITMLPDGENLKKVVSRIMPEMGKNKTLIDCSTIDVETTLFVSNEAKNHNLNILDAPVSGGINGAKFGTLTFMIGGSKNIFRLAKPLFEIMGQKYVHCGKNGSGQAAKICNNMILGATMIATCESIALADRLGLEREKFFDVVSTSSGNSWSLNTYCPAPGIGPKTPADNNYIPGFSTELMIKDLSLARLAAKSTNSDTPMGSMALNLYKEFVEKENGKGLDFSAMLPRFEKRKRK